MVVYPAYPAYIELVDNLWQSRWIRYPLKHCWVAALVFHCVYLPTALWYWVQHGSEYIWATPASLHAVFCLVAVFMAWGLFYGGLEKNRSQQRGYMISFLCWAILNLVAVVVPMVVAGCGLKVVPLIQCLFSTAVVLGKPVIPVVRKLAWDRHGRQLASRSTTNSGGATFDA